LSPALPCEPTLAYFYGLFPFVDNHVGEHLVEFGNVHDFHVFANDASHHDFGAVFSNGGSSLSAAGYFAGCSL
jgi:hypothetical protein